MKARRRRDSLIKKQRVLLTDELHLLRLLGPRLSFAAGLLEGCIAPSISCFGNWESMRVAVLLGDQPATRDRGLIIGKSMQPSIRYRPTGVAILGRTPIVSWRLSMDHVRDGCSCDLFEQPRKSKVIHELKNRGKLIPSRTMNN